MALSGNISIDYNENTVTSTQSTDVSVIGLPTVTVYVRGTFTGTVDFYASVDGVTFDIPISATNMGIGDGSLFTQAAVEGIFRMAVTGFQGFRAAGSILSGSADVKVLASIGDSSIDTILGYIFTKSSMRDGSGTDLTSTTSGLRQGLDVNLSSSSITLPVSLTSTTITGTVAVTQSTSPWVSNVTQFGSNAVVTGAGASGLGIPRFTISNDSNILATQSGVWNINNISGTVSLPTGAATETTLAALNARFNSDIRVSDISNTTGVQGGVSVTTTATAIRVGGSNLASRKTLTATKNSAGTIYWGYDNTVTTTSGTPFVNNQFASWALGPSITIFMIASAGSHNIRVTESS